MIQHADSKTSERKRPKDDSDVVNIKKLEEPPSKKRKTTDKQKAKAKPERSEPTEEADPKVKVKPANPLGAIIGRKRKERKSGKKGGR